MSDINNQICDAIGIIVDKKLSQANFDKTIQATIVAQGDKTKGEYKVKYLDSSFYAYDKSGNDYAVGTQVYVLVPENDLSKVKTILGTANKTKDIQPIIPEGNKFEYLTNNLFIIPKNKEFGIKSWKNSSISIYNVENNNNTNFEIDTDALSYIEKEGFDYFILKCNVRTNLQESQQSLGTYGIRIIISADLRENQQNNDKEENTDSTDNNNTEENTDSTNNNTEENTDSIDNNTENQKTQNLTLDFTLDSTMMVGNPYSLVIPVEQIAGFNVANYTNIVIKNVSLFSDKFTSLNEGEEGKENNIFFTDLSLQCANKISADNLNGNYLYISVPNGQYLSAEGGKNSVILKAIFQSKGQIIDPAKYSGLTYYWFKKNPSVSVANNEGKYCKINGINTEGWECLNSYDKKTGIFAAGNDTYIINKNSFLSNQQEYRCIALFDNLAYSKTKMVYNKNPQYFISLTSDSGTIFYNNNGEPTLTCSCRKADANEETITLSNYDWYTTKVDGQRKHQETASSQSKEKSVYSISINEYPDKVIVDCAVTKPDTTFIGVGTLELLNLKSDAIMPYNLTINNGSQMFKYNTLGISPIHSSSTNSNVEPSQKEKNAVLQPLSFTLVNNKTGEEFTEGSSQKWILPPDNETMFDFSTLEDIQDYNKEDYEGYRIYKGTSLDFSIKSKYDYTKINNTILLEVVKENQTYKAKTNILFVKEGDNGTNGTDYVCQIVGIQDNKETSFSEGIPYYYYNKGNGNKFYYKQKPINNQLKLKVFKNGENIEIDNSQITWSILKSPFFKNGDDYTSTKDYPSILTVNNSGIIKEDENYKSLSDIKDIANIIIIKAECSFKDANNNKKLIYATLPIGIVLNNSDFENNYIEDNTGFYYVIYDADGTNPSYDNTDAGIFTISVPKKRKYIYKWKTIGEQLYLQDVKEKDENNNDKIIPNKIKVIAKEPLLAENISNGITCEIYLVKDTDVITYDKNGEVLINRKRFSPTHQIIIPIHLYTNRFGHAAINGWDGNTVSIDTEGGVVLAPQIGAGFKNENNAFTGVLMGTSLLKDNEKSTTDKNVYLKETGLMGLHNGERSFFLKSEDGSATFGKNGSGQIKILPVDENGKPKATITGGLYPKDNDGNSSGMEINLSEPSITYGSGKFSVNKDGVLKCTDATINGWFFAEKTYDDGKKYGHYKLEFSETGSSIFMQNGIVAQKDKDNTILKSENDIIIKPGYFRVGSASGKLEPGINPEDNLDKIYLEDKDTGIEIDSESYFKYDNGKVTLKGDFYNSFEDKDKNGNILGSGQVSFSGKKGINMEYQTTKDASDLSQSFCAFSLNHQSFLFEKRRTPTEEELEIINAPANGPLKEEKIFTDNEGNVIESGISYTQSGGLKIVGKLTATSGTIGGWRITDKYIASQNNEVILYSDGRIIGQYKNKYNGKETGNDSDFSMVGDQSKVSFTNSGMSTFKYVPASASSSDPSRKFYYRVWHEYTPEDLETILPAARQGDVGYWSWEGLDPYKDSTAPKDVYGEPYLITRFQTSIGQWREVYARDKINSWVSFASIGVKKAVVKEKDDSTDVDQVSIEAQQPKTPICFSVASNKNLASNTMKFSEPRKKKTSEGTKAASTLSSKASDSGKASSDEIQYAELSFPYSETTTEKDKNDKDVKVTKEYDGTRISAVKIITGDVEIDENAKVQMKTRSAHSLVSAVNEMLTPPDQVQYIDGEANPNGITIDKITETWKAKNGVPAFQFNYQVHIENKGKADESVKYLIREDKTEGEGENKKVILPGYTIELTGF